MISDADRAHWGIAAYLFSLDLGADLATVALPHAPWGALRPAIRDAILWNRQAVEAGKPALFLRDAIGAALQGRKVTPPQDFLVWVETRLVTEGRRANGMIPRLLPLGAPALLARVDDALKLPKGYAPLVHGAIDPVASEALLDAVFAADGLIDRGDLSPWDQELIARNADHHAPDNPLAPLIHSLTQGLAAAAADQVAVRLAPAQRAALDALCAGGAG
ncbi:MAG: hypothetical protein MUD11_09455 [Rhodobacteraceae bacterium]|nr:hypothetical protein [Paracoccaceae bacterium]